MSCLARGVPTVIHDLSLPLAGEGAPLIIPASQPCIRLTLSLVHGTRAAYRLYLGTRGAAPEVPAERTRVARCAPARCRRLDNGPATGVLEPHALGGTPGVVGFALVERRDTGKR